MNWEAVTGVGAIVIAALQFYNAYTSQKTALAVAKLEGAIKEWARDKFVSKDDIMSLKVLGPVRDAAQVRDSASRIVG